MLNGAFGNDKANSLMGDYASLLGDAVLRHRARIAEHTAQIEAELASKVKSEFISNMSHELRTPLNTIIGFSKILTEHNDRKLTDTTIVEYSNLIQDAAGHLLSVINDILDISKIQSGKYTLNSRTINLREILESTYRSFKQTAADAEIRLIYRVPNNLPEQRGDAKKLEQVFVNLITNAIKFTEPGGEITLSAIRLKHDGVAVTIKDTGIGMSDEEIELAKTPFAQVNGTRTRWREGTGLGLPIAQALVDLHGGELNIQSAKGMGTQVTVRLPSSNEVSVSQGPNTVLGQGTNHASRTDPTPQHAHSPNPARTTGSDPAGAPASTPHRTDTTIHNPNQTRTA